MSRKENRRGPASGGAGIAARGGYEVGYGRPPKAHQFEPGKSGNPNGRPKGAKNEDTIFRDILNMKIAMSVGGRTRKVPLLKAVWTRVADDALKGNARAVALLLNRCRLLEGVAPENSGLDQDDRQVLQSYFRQVEAELKAKMEKA
jgi:hypothetical protein